MSRQTGRSTISGQWERGVSEIDTGKQLSLVASFAWTFWRRGARARSNNADVGKRERQGVCLGLKTGAVVWLVATDVVWDDLSPGGERDAVAGLIEANWLSTKGHNVKVSYDYFDPDDNVGENHQVRYRVVWEFTPMQFLQGRRGARIDDGMPQVNLQNRDEFFAELHGFF